MLIVCAGPDSFQALRKARELELAYREKYDPTGISVEHLTTTKLEALAERMGSVGLFAQRRCLRVTNLISSWKKADWDRATKLFARDAEQTIVISLEDELTPEAEKIVSAWDRSRIYRSYIKTGRDFEQYAEQLAREKQIEFVQELRDFARSIEGDAWGFWNALPRWQATRTVPGSIGGDATVFAKSDQYLLGTGSDRLQALAGGEDLLPLMLQQARQGLRVLAHSADTRTPAFALRKWERLSGAQTNVFQQRARALMGATIAQRFGAVSGDETTILL